MTQYIDKSAVVAEIERRLKEYRTFPEHQTDSNYMELCEILSFIDTLETKEVDLEEECKTYLKNNFTSKEAPDEFLTTQMQLDDMVLFARHFFEFGLRAKDVNEIIKTAEDHAYFAGSENTREKLIDKACEWLLNNVRYYSTNALGAEYMCEDLRKAMSNEIE